MYFLTPGIRKMVKGRIFAALGGIFRAAIKKDEEGFSVQKAIQASLLSALVSLPCLSFDGDMLVSEDIGWLRVNKNSDFLVSISDSVVDQCWTGSDAVKTALELELKRSGFKVKEEPILPVLISVSSVGYALEKGVSCAASYRISVSVIHADSWISEDKKLLTFQYREIWSTNGILSGAKNNFDFRLKEQYVQGIQSFLNEIDTRKTKIIEDVKSNSDVSNDVREFWQNRLSRLN